MAWIGLKDMHIQNAPIGYYPEEKLIGNTFHVSVSANMEIPDPEADNLANTLNYETVYDVVTEVMFQEMDLIETAAYRIYQGLKAKGPAFNALEITIRKQKPMQVSQGGDSVLTMQFP